MPSFGSDPQIEDLIREIVRGALAHVHTLEFGKVQAFDSVSNPPRADISLVTRRLRYNEDGDLEQYTPPMLTDVPIAYPVSSGGSIYFPLRVGDEVMVVYAERDSDNAIETGNDLNDAATPRRHSDMDPIAHPLAWSSSVPLTARSTDGLVIEHDKLIKLGEAATEWATTAQKVLTRLNLIETALKDHTHGGIQIGGGTTSAAGPVVVNTVLLQLTGENAKVQIEVD